MRVLSLFANIGVAEAYMKDIGVDIFKNIALEWADFDDVAGWLDRPVGVVMQEYNNTWLALRNMEI